MPPKIGRSKLRRASADLAIGLANFAQTWSKSPQSYPRRNRCGLNQSRPPSAKGAPDDPANRAQPWSTSRRKWPSPKATDLGSNSDRHAEVVPGPRLKPFSPGPLKSESVAPRACKSTSTIKITTKSADVSNNVLDGAPTRGLHVGVAIGIESTDFGPSLDDSRPC